MDHLQSNSLNALSMRRCHNLTRLWEVERADGWIYRFSEVPWTVTFNGEDYYPTSGVNASAIEDKAGLKSSNLDVIGVLSSDAIIEDDLRTQKFDNARITAYYVHWDAPWQNMDSDGVESAIAKEVFLVERVIWSDIGWKAELSDLTRLLGQEIGDVMNRTCPYIVGDTKCTVNIAGLSVSGQVSAVSIERLAIETNLSAQPDGYFQFGVLTWSTGNNKGLQSGIQQSKNTNSELFFTERTQYYIGVGDQFNITPGCDGRFESCGFKQNAAGTPIFANRVNFGGHPHIPGTDRMLETP